MRLGAGAKYGLLAGLLYGVVTAPVTYYTYMLMLPYVAEAAASAIPAEAGVSAEQIEEVMRGTAIFVPLATVVFSLLYPGVLVGLLGAFLWDRLPGTWPLRSLAIGLIVIVISLALSALGQPGPALAPSELVDHVRLVTLLANVLAGLLYGAVFGYMAARGKA